MENATQPSTGIGYLTVRVSTAQGAVPLPGATVIIRSANKSDSGDSNSSSNSNSDYIRTARTNADGLTEKIALPTSPREESESPGFQIPFLSYNMDVSLPGYYTQYYMNIPVFDGIAARQSVEMIPLPQNGYDLSLSPDDQRFFEGENPNL